MNIVITGATGGIGELLTKHLAEKHHVVALARDKKKLIKLKGKNIKVISIDVTDKQSVKKAFQSINGKVDVLINCAGLLRPVGKLLDNDLDQWKKTIEVNLLGTVYSCYYAIPLLLKSSHGKIINFSGGGSAYPRPYHSAYASSKAAVVRFTETIAMEYPMLDINAIAPGAHKTPMWQDEKHDAEPKQWGDKNQLKSFIDYLISDKSNGISGRFIHYKDDWKNFKSKKLSKDIYTLRRVEK